MSTQDKLERVLRDIHVLISRSELYDNTGDKIIVEKKKMFEHLNHLNACIYEMMDEYEVTQQSHDKAEREAKRKGDEIVFRASRNAEDVYAAAVLYTDDALQRVQHIMKDTTDTINDILKKAQSDMDERKAVIKENQLELKCQLQDMVDTEKYLKLIEVRNKELEEARTQKKEQEEKGGRIEKTVKNETKYTRPEIRINPEYFKKAGIPLEEPEKEEKKPEIPEISVDLDAEYFKWKKGGTEQKGNSVAAAKKESK